METNFFELSKKYMEHDGYMCPYCGSYDLDSNVLEVDGPDAWLDVQCNNCGKWWTDTYTLTDVTFKDETE